MRILHIEVGGSYGGSLRALENYLTCSDRRRFEHDFLLYYPTPGAERLQSLVNNFRVRYSAAPTPASPNDNQGSSNTLKQQLRRTRAMPYVSKGLLWAKIIRGSLRARRLGKDLRAGNYDLVHVNNTIPYNVEALIAANFAGIPAVGHARNPIQANIFNKWALRMTCGVATVNQCLQGQLTALVPELPIQACYDGVALGPVDINAVTELRNSLQDCGKSLICSAGRLDEQKGFIYLIQAARQVLGARPDVSFVIAGDGPLRAQLQDLIDELRMTDHFRLLGFRHDIQNVISASDLFVSSSLWEGGPITAVESVMLAKPMVLTKVGVSREVMVQGKNGYMVHPADPEALAKAILTSLENLPTLTDGAGELRKTLAAPMEVGASARVLDEFFERIAKSKVN